MEFDLSKPHCYYFNEICKIPHGSGNEKALSDWIVAFAKERGLSYIQDDMWNVVIYKPATAGYEDHPGVVIQAHMDMVCEKVPESAHDFEKDPLELYVDGTHLRARGTTLGGDDCMGVAYMLDILSDDALAHPYLECCFTVQEETGLFGARALKPDYFKARRLINLDGAGEYRTYTTLAGARNLTIEKKLTFVQTAGSAWRLRVDGLLGGRTGDDIGKERANAGKLIARILYAFHRAGIVFGIVELTSSNKKSGIPPEGEAVFVTEAEEEKLKQALSVVREAVAEEYEFSDPDIRITLERTDARSASSALADTGADAADTRTEAATYFAADAKESLALAELLYLLPYGVFARFFKLDGLPSYSANLGKIRLENGVAVIKYAARSPFESCMDEAEYGVRLLCEKTGAKVTGRDDYYGYRYRADSPLRDVMDRVFLAQYGKPLAHVAAHGGNECGAFCHMFPDMDIVTTGAIYAKHHTPEEYLDLESFDRSIRFLKSFLEAL